MDTSGILLIKASANSSTTALHQFHVPQSENTGVISWTLTSQVESV